MGKLTKVDSLLVRRASEKRFRSAVEGESRSSSSLVTSPHRLHAALFKRSLLASSLCQRMAAKYTSLREEYYNSLLLLWIPTGFSSPSRTSSLVKSRMQSIRLTSP
ncbi:hypothetical protein GOODEAATRI_016579 [Goodea atripinnis]|uniref:Uncharacterized protein n=1 Tax=Goodea atripinnis TaxID=208336 RepID=A0ABV0NB69_9TELE